MSKYRVVVLKIVAEQLTVAAAAAQYGISRRHLHRLLARYRGGGLEAVEPRSRRPHTNPTATPEEVRDRIIGMR
ncbi:MAG TPA: leucine zipper domain-containing protein, partial [Microbacterium sp.]|nr:leucine zipper domain-containing protein [Microbacterium sp.]